MSSADLYESYKTKMQKIADVKFASAVLQWDQETYLPPNGASFRGRQIATLAEIAHQEFTDESVGHLLKDLLSGENLPDRHKKNVALSFEDYTRSVKFTPAFVRKMSEAVSKAYHDWISARKANSFQLFSKSLSEIVELKKQEADIIGFGKHPYDALMNDYDKGLTVEKTDAIFSDLQPGLSTLLAHINSRPQVSNDFLFQFYGKDKQWDFGLQILRQMGYDFDSGRQDISEHPFTTNFNNADVRVTTRINENDFGNMLWSCIHEGGHALYEQGLPGDEYGLPLGEYCSLSIHESQSRLWENCIGRGLPFWNHNYASLQSIFSTQLQGISVLDFYRGINKVQPSLIRTEADELTYHFHVMIRYEIEKRLIDGSLTVKEIPEIWNHLYKKYLGLNVPDDRQGCLQDIHWSHGSFGYFATYSIGSLYASQIYAAIILQNPAVENDIMAGRNDVVLDWLKQHIFRFGRYYTSEALCKQATGSELDSGHFIKYATTKFSEIYVS